MLVIYRKESGTVSSVSGARPVGNLPIPESMIYLQLIDPLSEEYDAFYITDRDKIVSAWDVWDIAQETDSECEVVFDDTGNPVGIRLRADSPVKGDSLS